MALTFGFYDSLNHDRLYNAQQMSAIFDGIINDGVFASVGSHFSVVPGTGMHVLVKSGRAWFNSTWTLNDSDIDLTIDAADSLLGRIDTVVLEVNSEQATRANSIKVVKGTAASTPAKPTLINTATVHQHPLAHITVAKNTTAITASMIEIVVGKTDCPFVTAILQTTDITNLFEKWENDFQTWFSTVRSTLDGDVALNLQNQIDANWRNTLNTTTPPKVGMDAASTPADILDALVDLGNLYVWKRRSFTLTSRGHSSNPASIKIGQLHTGTFYITSTSLATNHGMSFFKSYYPPITDNALSSISSTTWTQVYIYGIGSENSTSSMNKVYRGLFLAPEPAYGWSTYSSGLPTDGSPIYLPYDVNWTADGTASCIDKYYDIEVVPGSEKTSNIINETDDYPVSKYPTTYTIDEKIPDDLTISVASTIDKPIILYRGFDASPKTFLCASEIYTDEKGKVQLKDPTTITTVTNMNANISDIYSDTSSFVGKYLQATSWRSYTGTTDKYYPFEDTSRIVYIPSDATISIETVTPVPGSTTTWAHKCAIVDKVQCIYVNFKSPPSIVSSLIGKMGDSKNLVKTSYIGTGVESSLSNPKIVSFPLPVKEFYTPSCYYDDEAEQRIVRVSDLPVDFYEKRFIHGLLDRSGDNASQVYIKRSYDQKNIYWYDATPTYNLMNTSGETYTFYGVPD